MLQIISFCVNALFCASKHVVKHTKQLCGVNSPNLITNITPLFHQIKYTALYWYANGRKLAYKNVSRFLGIGKHVRLQYSDSLLNGIHRAELVHTHLHHVFADFVMAMGVIYHRCNNKASVTTASIS